MLSYPEVFHALRTQLDNEKHLEGSEEEVNHREESARASIIEEAATRSRQLLDLGTTSADVGPEP